jgi:hypothetical protein
LQWNDKEVEVQRLSLALAVTAIMLGCGTVTWAGVVVSSFSQAVGQIEKIWLRFALSQPEIVAFTIFYQKD